MAKPEDKRILTPEAANVSPQSRFTDSNRSYYPSHSLDDDSNDDLHGAAAMALTALSSGLGATSAAKPDREITSRITSYPNRYSTDMEFEAIESVKLGMVGNRETISRLSPKSFSFTAAAHVPSNRQGGHLDPSNEEYRMSTNTLGGESVVEHERTRDTKSDVLAGAGDRQSKTDSAYNTLSATSTTFLSDNNMPTSPPFSTLIGQPLDSPMEYPKRIASQVPGERMHTLSYLLEDQLSLTTMTSDNRNYIGENINRQRDDNEFPGYRSRARSAQTYSEYHPYRQSHSSPNLRMLTDENQEGVPVGTRPFSTSPPLDHSMNKPKRKYTKKSPTSLSAMESQSQTSSLITHKTELLQSDRGLILKTQIPKKGRPISKHSSSQNTPTLTSLGVLPASHPYFSSKAGVTSSSPPILPLGTNRNMNNTDYFNLVNNTSGEIQVQNPVRRRPGRPPLAVTIARLAQSQSHPSLLSASTSRSSHDYGLEPHYVQPRDSRTYNRPPPLPSRERAPPSPTTAQSLAQHHSHVQSGSHVRDTIDYEQSRESQSYDKAYRSQTPPTPGLGSIVEGVPTQLVNRKRDSYGAEKRQSTEDYHRFEDERGSISSIHDINEGQDGHYQDQFDHTKGGRSRKRLSRTEMEAPALETNARDKTEIVQKWLGYSQDQTRPRPRSLVLPRGVNDITGQFHARAQSIAVLTPTSESHYYLHDRDEEGRMQSYERERENRHSTSVIPRDSARRSLHSHARSLDITNRSHVFDRDIYLDDIHERQLTHDYQLPYGADSNIDHNNHSRSNPHSYQLASGYNGRDNPSSSKGQAYVDESLDFSEGQTDSVPSIRSGSGNTQDILTGVAGRGTILGHNKAPSRKIARRGPGPYLKKHQILQQQLSQMQREQEEIEVHLVARQQHEQQRYIHETNSRTRPSQHSRHISMDQEFYSQHQNHQPQPGRPPKQRVLMRSESASSGLHNAHQSYPQPQQHFHNQSLTGSQQSQQQPAQPRRRQNHHQPILLRPVSLPSLSDQSSSSLYCTQPPPGQPLYRSMHAPYLVSPSSLTSVASTASSSSTLHTVGGGMVASVDQEGFSQEPDQAVISPDIPQSVTPPSKGSKLHSPTYGHNDTHNYMSSQQTQGFHPPSHQRGGNGGAMSRTDSRTETMSNCSSTNTLVHSSSQQSLHRHSTSLPAMHYSLSSDYQHQQQHFISDHTRPPMQRYDADPISKKPTPSSPSSTYKTGLLTTSDDESVRGLHIRTPPQNI